MSDHEAIQGCWRLVSRLHRGKPVHDSATHWLFSGDKHKEIVPSLVDDGKLRSTFSLNEETDPKAIVITLDYNGPDGPPDPHPIVLRGFYRFKGDQLEICFGILSQFPESFSDENGLVTLQRHAGAVPESRKSSGTPALADEVLGRLAWDDNLNWYSGKIAKGDISVEVSLTRDQHGSVDRTQARARHVVQNLPTYIELARRYAVENLLDLKNDNWLDEEEEPLTAAAFRQRMTLESMVFSSNGGITFYHDDGNLFWGHCIQICVDAQDQCVGADIPG
jgi:uncharacterized protein (TIGR03067 family)